MAASGGQVQKSEICFLVLGFLKDFKFKASYDAFLKESELIVRSLKRVAGRPVKPLEAILNEYIFMKQQELHKQQLLTLFGQQPALTSTLKNMSTLLEDYMTIRNTYIPPPSLSNTNTNTTTSTTQQKSNKPFNKQPTSTQINETEYSTMYNNYNTTNDYIADDYGTVDVNYETNGFYQSSSDPTAGLKLDQNLPTTSVYSSPVSSNTTNNSSTPRPSGFRNTDTPKRKSLTPRKITFSESANTSHTYQPEPHAQISDIASAVGQLDDSNDLGEPMDLDSIMNFLGGEGVRALLNNTQLHETIARHINTHLPPNEIDATLQQETVVPLDPPPITSNTTTTTTTTTTATTTTTTSDPPDSITNAAPLPTGDVTNLLPHESSEDTTQNDAVLEPQVLNHIVDSIEHDPAFDAFFTSFIDFPSTAPPTKTKSPSSNKTKNMTPRKLPYTSTTTVLSPYRSPPIHASADTSPILLAVSQITEDSSQSDHSNNTDPSNSASVSIDNINHNNNTNVPSNIPSDTTSTTIDTNTTVVDLDLLKREDTSEPAKGKLVESSRKRKLEYGDPTESKNSKEETAPNNEANPISVPDNDIDDFLSSLKYDNNSQ